MSCKGANVLWVFCLNRLRILSISFGLYIIHEIQKVVIHKILCIIYHRGLIGGTGGTKIGLQARLKRLILPYSRASGQTSSFTSEAATGNKQRNQETEIKSEN